MIFRINIVRKTSKSPSDEYMQVSSLTTNVNFGSQNIVLRILYEKGTNTFIHISISNIGDCNWKATI